MQTKLETIAQEALFEEPKSVFYLAIFTKNRKVGFVADDGSWQVDHEYIQDNPNLAFPFEKFQNAVNYGEKLVNNQEHFIGYSVIQKETNYKITTEMSCEKGID